MEDAASRETLILGMEALPVCRPLLSLLSLCMNAQKLILDSPHSRRHVSSTSKIAPALEYNPCPLGLLPFFS
jgi:hypothetical protein